MHHLEKRIAAVESRNKNPTRFVWRNSGETPDEANTRTGASGEDVIISWHDVTRKYRSSNALIQFG